MKLLKKLLITFILLITIYVSSLTAVFMLPSENIQSNVFKNISILVSKKDNVYIFNRKSDLIQDRAGYIDALTDAVMLTRNINFNTTDNKEARVIQSFFRFPHSFSNNIYSSPLKSAMNMNGYARYWHGYDIFLRPLLTVMDYVQIRQFNNVVFYTAFLWVLYIMFTRLGKYIASLFFVGMCLCKFPLIPLSIQFMNMFMLMLTILIGLHYWLNDKNETAIIKGENNPLYIMCFGIGSMTAFFDLLTTPLLPIGMFLFFIIAYFHNKHAYNFTWRFIITALVIWIAGYLGTWATKWVIIYFILNSNIFGEALNSIVLRVSEISITDGGKALKATRDMSLIVNIDLLAAPFNGLIAVKILLIIIAGVFLLAHFYPRRKDIYSAQLLLLCLLPVAWYLFIVNHSFIHCWYTYRNLLFTVMCLGVYLKEKVDWQQFCQSLKNR